MNLFNAPSVLTDPHNPDRCTVRYGKDVEFALVFATIPEKNYRIDWPGNEVFHARDLCTGDHHTVRLDSDTEYRRHATEASVRVPSALIDVCARLLACSRLRAAGTAPVLDADTLRTMLSIDPEFPVPQTRLKPVHPGDPVDPSNALILDLQKSWPKGRHHIPRPYVLASLLHNPNALPLTPCFLPGPSVKPNVDPSTTVLRGFSTRTRVSGTRHARTIRATLRCCQLRNRNHSTPEIFTHEISLSWLLHPRGLISLRGHEPDPATLARALSLALDRNTDPKGHLLSDTSANLNSPVIRAWTTVLLEKLGALPPATDTARIYRDAVEHKFAAPAP